MHSQTNFKSSCLVYTVQYTSNYLLPIIGVWQLVLCYIAISHQNSLPNLYLQQASNYQVRTMQSVNDNHWIFVLRIILSWTPTVFIYATPLIQSRENIISMDYSYLLFGKTCLRVRSRCVEQCQKNLNVYICYELRQAAGLVLLKPKKENFL